MFAPVSAFVTAIVIVNIHVLFRLVWVLIVTATLASFTALVVGRIQLYYKYPTMIDLSVEYKDELTFPAVTVCNENTFRWR